MSVVSSVLSRVSTRSRASMGWNINVGFSSLMDSLFSIVFGLGLRLVVDAVSRQDFKLTGTLVGLWEGVILLHFTKKTPRSSDPYIAFAVRLCVDFYLTESVSRLVLVLIWTGLGMVLADITPAIWSDVGLNRVWRRLRRDLYTISQMIPTVAFGPPQRTVRFSPSHAPSVIGEEDDVDDAASDITATAAHTPAAPSPPNPILPPSRDARKRRVPGHYGFEYSDTETERSFAVPRAAGPSTGRTSRRQSLYPPAYDESVSSLTPTEDVDVDAGNLSDGSTERAGPSSASVVQMSEAQEAPAEVAAVTATAAAVPPTIDTSVAVPATTKADADEGPHTPPQQPLWIPPTPSDSAAAWRLNRAREAATLDTSAPASALGPAPLSAVTPVLPIPPRAPALSAQIPDFLDQPLTEDWTDIGRSVAADPFTAAVHGLAPPAAPVPAPAATTAPAPAPGPVPTATTDAPQAAVEAQEAEDAGEHNTLLDPPAPAPAPAAPPPPLADREYKTAADFDDIYGDEPQSAAAPAPALAAEAEAEATFAGETGDLLGDAGEGGTAAAAAAGAGAEAAAVGGAVAVPPVGGGGEFGLDAENVWDDAAAQAEAEAARADAEAEAALAAEEARYEQEEREREAEAQRQAEEAEAAEAHRVAEEAETQKRAEEAEAQRLAEEAAAAAALAKRLAEEEAAKRAEEEAAAAATAADAAAAKKAKKEALKKKKEKEKEKEKKDAEERRAKEEADELVRQQKRAEEEAREREEEEKREAERKAKEEEEAQQLAREKEEAKRQEQVERERLEREEAERQEQRAREEAERKEQEAAEQAAAAAVDAALAQEKADAEAQAQAAQGEQASPEHEGEAAAAAAEGNEDLPVSTGFSPESLVNLDEEPLTPTAPPAPLDSTVPEHAEEPAAAEPEPTPAPAAPAYEESVVSDASGVAPPDPRERVERMLILRAQMVEIQKQIDELRAAGTGEEVRLAQMEKIMRKMVRQATRRYAAGIECAMFLNSFDDSADLVSLENVHPGTVIKKVAEQIESLMSPSAKSLHFKVQVTKKNQEAKKQKPKVLELLDEYNLTNYTTENAVNRKICEIDIPEEVFGTWLTDYRNVVAKRAKQEEDPEYAPWG